MSYYSENISVNVSKEMKDKLKNISKREEDKLSSTIRRILKEGLYSREKKKKFTRVD